MHYVYNSGLKKVRPSFKMHELTDYVSKKLSQKIFKTVY